MNLHDYLRILRRGLWIIALLTLAGAGVGAAAAVVATPKYEVTATVYLAVTGGTSAGDLQQANVFAMQKAATYADLALTEGVLSAAADQLDDGTEVSDLRSTVSTAARSETSLIDVFAAGSDAEEVADRANAVAQALSAQARVLENPTGAPEAPPVSISVVDPARVPSVAVAPQPRYNVFAGAVVGLALGVGILVLRHALDIRIRTLDDLPRVPEFVTRTSIPFRGTRTSRTSRTELRLESFRTLRANLLFGGMQNGGSIAVAPVDPAADGPGIARQLSGVLAEIGTAVVIVDVDLRPTVGSRKLRKDQEQEPAAPGIADILRRKAVVDDGITSTGTHNLYAISAGAVDKSAAQLLSTNAMRELLIQLRKQFDYVVLVCPPLLARSEAAVIAALADSTLVVVEAGATKRPSFRFAMELLDGVRARAVSLLLDNVRDVGVSAGRRPPERPYEPLEQAALES